jgi:hypothetical protein
MQINLKYKRYHKVKKEYFKPFYLTISSVYKTLRDIKH